MRLAAAAGVGAILVATTAALAASRLGERQGERPPEVIYAKTCGYCHGRNVGPVIRGRALDAGTVETMVRHGRNGMPAFRPTEISPSELKALARWVAASKADPRDMGH